MVEEIRPEVIITLAPAGTVPFIPAEVKKIEIPMIPIVAPLEYVPPAFPPVPKLMPAIALPPEVKPLLLNIETTGIKPWEARIISITIKDPTFPEEEPTVIMYEDEKEILNYFFSAFLADTYNQIIGYNVSFDYRFIITRAMFHHLSCKEFVDAELYDMMSVMKQIKQKFVFGYNPTGTLSDWSEFFFNYPKPYTDEENQENYARGDWEKVREFSAAQVKRLYMLWALFRNTAEQVYTGIEF